MKEVEVDGKPARIKLRGADTMVNGKILQRSDGGFWLTLANDDLKKIVGPEHLPQAGTQAQVFVPASSILWLVLS